MPRGAASLKKELIERQFRGFMATHADAVRSAAEAYELSIKMPRIEVPDVVRLTVSMDAIDERIQREQEERLEQFAVDMMEDYPWIKHWGVEGRSGGWLYFATNDPVLDGNWQIPAGATIQDDPQDWAPPPIGAAETRLEDLIRIEKALKQAKAVLIKDFAYPAWWDDGPQDWAPKKKLKMSGIFDFMRKKQAPQKGELIRVDPVEIIPSGSLIRSGPPAAGTFANPFDLLAPPEPPRGLVAFAPKGPEPMFDLLVPEAPRREAHASPEPVRPPPPALRPPARAPRERGAWSLPGAEALAAHLRSMFNLAGIFSTVRAARNAPQFRRDLRHWGARGMPALIPVLPVSTRELYGDIAQFFGIPYSVLDGYSRAGDIDPRIWDDLFWPLFDTLSEAFEIEKPGDLPGWFAMEHDPDTDEWWVVYLEAE
jgi:hypothetical protein